MNKAVSSLILFFIILFTNHFVFAEDPFIPSEVTDAGQAVFKVITEYGSGSGFFIKDNKTFITSLNPILPVLVNIYNSSKGLGIFVMVDGKRVEVSEIQSLSLLHHQIVLKVEGYEGSFLEATDVPVSNNDKFYTLGFLPNNESVDMVKGRINPSLPGLHSYRVGTSYKVSAISNLTGMAGGPMLNEKGQVIGVFEYAIGDQKSLVQTLFVQKVLLGLLAEDQKITNLVTAKNYFEERIDALLELIQMDDVSALYGMSRVVRNIESLGFRMSNVWSVKKYTELAANRGHVIAQFILASMCLLGYGNCPVDEYQGVFLLKKFSEQRNPYIQTMLARILLSGDVEDIPQDVPQAVHLLELAARQGHIPAQLSLFHIYRRGLDEVQPSPAQATIWFNELLRRGYVMEDFFIAGIRMYYGIGSFLEDKHTGKWILQQLAEAGEYRSQALLLAEGGLPQDADHAMALIGELREVKANGEAQRLNHSSGSNIQDKDQALLVIEEVIKQMDSKRAVARSLSTPSCQNVFIN